MYRHLSGLGVAAAALLVRPAAANPRPLPFSYPYQTLAEDEAEIEQYVDMTPVRAIPVATGQPGWINIYRLQTEFEYGITDRLELGLYVQYVPSPSDAWSSVPSFSGGNGIKQRLRLRLAEEGQWPVDVALYGEVCELENELELEAKIILQKRFGKARAIVNLWGEREFYYDGRRDWVIHPTAGVTYEVTPTFHPGVEYWMRAEFPDNRPPQKVFNDGPNHFIGPVVMLSFGKLWWTTSVYWRANDANRTVAVGDNAGHVWARTVIGLSL
jgi:Putative MetA-pathway of phenol degradation